MARLSFSKASLHKEGAQLKRYRQYLPSLDLKRQQLIAERTKAIALLEKTEHAIRRSYLFVERQLPMLSDENIDLEGLVIIKEAVFSEENIVGVRLPAIQTIEITCQPYSFLTKPHWVDQVVIQLKLMLELKIRLKIEQQRLDVLQKAVKKVTQRVNLFDKVLIPKAQKNISKIRIFLSDSERASVVRAKITKQKRLKEAL
jgi:V/A-type H+-transporting ATPase subunit D